MTNEDIIEKLSLTASLMEINDENSFKSDAYRKAAFNLEKVDKDLFALPNDSIAKLDGVGKSIALAIVQMKEKGSFDELDKLLLTTPNGVVEMLSINGIGPKKIKVIWKELKIESKRELLEACKEGRVAQQKGFGEKTQKMIEDNLLFEQSQSGKLRLDQALIMGEEVKKALLSVFDRVEEAGQLYSKDEVVEELVFVVPNDDSLMAQQKMSQISVLHKDLKTSSPFVWRGSIKDTAVRVEVHVVPKAKAVSERYILSASNAHLSEMVAGKTVLGFLKANSFASETEVFEKLNVPFIAPELREGTGEWALALEQNLPQLISYQDLKGPLHNHSTWSDGKNTLANMVAYCKEQGWQYLGISDHSQSATYANGLYPERVLAQQKEIDALNASFDNFKIFKGIESDILGDGSLDYEDDILKSFDYIVASVHSGLSMDEDKATNRLIKAVENPYTTILGHPTGRLLLKRKGYPVDFHKVIDACAANGVAIEINANPWRLDISWKYVKYALDKGVKIAICPDAHENEGFLDMHYGVWMGRKGFLSSENCINCMSTKELNSYFGKKR
jgi:DNA polymerase (family X)